jgi:signal peptidase II
LAACLELVDRLMKKFFSRYGFLILLAGGVILLDQVTKILIRNRFEQWAGDGPWDFLGLQLFLVHMPNTGMMMGLFQGAGTIIAIIGLVIAGILIVIFPRISRQNWPARWGMGLLLGGILGNLIDRITLGYITDFVLIDPLPVFNLADIAVYTSVILLAAGVLLDGRRKSRQAPPLADPQE